MFSGKTPLETEPFEYLTVPGFMREDKIGAILESYPVIEKGGSYPLIALDYGPVFKELCDELQGDEMLRDAFAQKFDMNLANRPTTLTVRGRCRPKDGQIHTDSDSKLITVLVYLNETWDAEGGRLRLLRSADSLDDAFAEMPPEAGLHGVFQKPRECLARPRPVRWRAPRVAIELGHRRGRRPPIGTAPPALGVLEEAEPVQPGPAGTWLTLPFGRISESPRS